MALTALGGRACWLHARGASPIATKHARFGGPMQNPAFGSLSLESIISRTTPYGIQSGVYACIYTNPDVEGLGLLASLAAALSLSKLFSGGPAVSPRPDDPPVEADPDTGILVLCPRPDGKNGPTLLLIHVYYIKVHDSS